VHVYDCKDFEDNNLTIAAINAYFSIRNTLIKLFAKTSFQ